MAKSLADIVAEKQSAQSKAILGPLAGGTIPSVKQISPAPAKPGVSLSDIAQTNIRSQVQRAPQLLPEVKEPTTKPLGFFETIKQGVSNIPQLIVTGEQKLGEAGEKVEKFGTLQPGKEYSISDRIGAGIIRAAGTFMKSPNELNKKIADIADMVGTGKLSTTEGITQSVLNTGATALGTFYAPVQIALNSALNATGSADAYGKLIKSGTDNSSKFLQNAFNISKYKADSYVDDLYNVASVALGVKGGNTMNKGLSNIKTAPIKGTAQVVQGVLEQSSPDIAMALIGLAADGEGRVPTREDIENGLKGLGTVTIAGAIPGVQMPKGKTKVSVIPEIKPKIDLEKVVPETKTIEQNKIQLDKQIAEKVSPSKTIGTIDIKAFNEYRKTNPGATPSDYMKSLEGTQEKPATVIQPVKETKTISKVKEETPSVVNLSDIDTRIQEGGNVIQGKEFAYRPEKFEGAKKDILSGVAKPVRIEKIPNSDRYSIGNGFHRIDAAIELGLDKLPAIIDKKLGYIDIRNTNTPSVTVKPDKITTVKTGQPTIEPILTIEEGPFGPKKVSPTIGSAKNIIDQSYIPEGLGSFSIKPLALKGAARGLNLDTYLSNIRLNIGGKYVGEFNRVIQGLKNVGKQVANKLAEGFGIKKSISDISQKKELVDSTWRNIEKDLKNNLIDGITPNENTKITPDNVNIAIDTLNEGDKFDYSSTFSDLKDADINNVIKIGYIYDLFKNNKSKLDQLIPKELQDFYSNLENLNRKAYDTIGNDAVNRGLLGKYNIEDEYVRFVILPESRKRLENLTGKSIFTTSDGIEHKSFLDMETHIKAMKKAGKTITPLFDVTKLSSILKEKKAGIDLYRFNSPVAQILDYMRQYGDLNKNDAVFKMFDELDKSKDPNVKKYIDGLYDSKIYQNPLEQAINLGGEETSLPIKIAQGSVKAGSKLVLYGGIDTLAQAATQGTIRNIALGKVPAKIITDRTAKNILDQYGITQGFELSSLGGIVGNKNIALFSGVPIENIQKTAIAVPMMKEFVKGIGNIDVSKMKDTEVIKEFDNIMKNADIGTRTKILDSIYDQTNFVSNTSSLARSSINILNKYGFTSLKSFDTNTLGQLMQNIHNTIVGGGTSSRIDTAIRTLVPIVTAIAIQQAYVAANKDPEKKGTDEGLLKAKGSQIAQQFVGNPFVNARDFAGGLLGNIGNLPADFVKQSVNALLLLKNSDKEMAVKTGLNSVIDLFLKKIQIGQVFDKGARIVGDKTLQDLISDKLGVTSLEDQTSKLNAKGFKIDSATEAALQLLGVRLDQATQNYLYDTIAKEKIAQDYPNATTPGQILMAYIDSTKSKLQRDAEGFFLNPYSWGNIGQYNDQMMQQSYVAATMRNKDGNTTLSDFLERVGIAPELKEDIIGAKKSNIKASRTSNKNIEKALGEFFFQYGIEGDTFSDQLNNLERINPKAFNDFISGIARTKFFLDNNPEADITKQLTIDQIKPFFQNSTTYTDAAIADYSDKTPLSTALTESLQRSLFDFNGKLSEKGGIEKAKQALGDIEKVYSIIMGNEKHTDGITKAASLKSLELSNALTEMKKQGYNSFQKDFPILTDVILRGLELRGEAISKSSTEIPEQTSTNGVGTQPTSTSAGLPTLQSFITKPTGTQGLLLPEKKQKTQKFSDLIHQSKIAQSTQLLGQPEIKNTMSLSEIVKRINSQKT